ncbi:flagellar type III secretion system pore protein FliP [Aeromonas hydrophila]
MRPFEFRLQGAPLALGGDLLRQQLLFGEGALLGLLLQLAKFGTKLGQRLLLLLHLQGEASQLVVIGAGHLGLLGAGEPIGLQQSPSNQVLIGIALFMSFFIMSPVLDRINNEALQPYLAETIQAKEALEKAELPIHQFMLAQTRIKDLNTFMEIANVQVDKPADVPLRVLIPAFVTSELKTAFQIGFMLFLPFLVIDLVVASILMAMGMMMLSPMLVSLPFKLMLFVMVDGWNLILGSLANSFGLGAGG